MRAAWHSVVPCAGNYEVLRNLRNLGARAKGEDAFQAEKKFQFTGFRLRVRYCTNIQFS